MYQDIEATSTSININKETYKEDVAHLYNGILLGHKRNGIVSFAEMWMDLESVIRSEVSQKEETNIAHSSFLLLLNPTCLPETTACGSWGLWNQMMGVQILILHWQSVWPCYLTLTSLCLYFPNYRMEAMIVPASKDCYEN